MVRRRPLPWPQDPHTAAKHELLRLYLEQWLPKLLQTSGISGVTYLEGFAGPGVYDGGQPGSPVVALQAFLKFPRLLAAGKPVNILLNDADPRCVESLRQRMNTAIAARAGGIPGNIRIRYREGECGLPLLDELMAPSTRDLPLFAFLDSYGGPDIDFELVRAIAARPSAEVLITFGPRFLIRFGEDPRHRSSGDAAFGSADWQRVYDQYPSQKRTFLVTAYHSALRTAGFRHTLQFELLDEDSHPLFLLYGTKHPKGISAMKYAMWTVDPIYGARYRDPRDPSQQALDLCLEPDIGPLCRLLLSELDHGARTVAQLRDYALFETIYRPEQVPAAVERLRSDGRAETTPNRRQITGRTVVHRKAMDPLF